LPVRRDVKVNQQVQVVHEAIPSRHASCANPHQSSCRRTTASAGFSSTPAATLAGPALRMFVQATTGHEPHFRQHHSCREGGRWASVPDRIAPRQRCERAPSRTWQQPECPSLPTALRHFPSEFRIFEPGPQFANDMHQPDNQTRRRRSQFAFVRNYAREGPLLPLDHQRDF
jgi:hypothetical protein